MNADQLLGYAAIRSRLAPRDLAPEAADLLITQGLAEPYRMILGGQAIRLTDRGMRAAGMHDA